MVGVTAGQFGVAADAKRLNPVLSSGVDGACGRCGRRLVPRGGRRVCGRRSLGGGPGRGAVLRLLLVLVPDQRLAFGVDGFLAV